MGELAPCDEEGFLGEVFALGEAAGGAVCQGADQGLVAGNDLAEGIAIAGDGFGDEGVIGGGLEGGREEIIHFTA